MGGVMKAMLKVLEECIQKATHIDDKFTASSDGAPGRLAQTVAVDPERFLTELDGCGLMVRHK